MELKGGIRVDLVGHELTEPNGRVRSLTILEADALRFLGKAAGAPVQRVDLERKVWGFRAGTRSEAVPVAMRRLRAKVGDALETVRGVGWRLQLGELAPTRLEPTPITAWFDRAVLERSLQMALDQPHRPTAVVGASGAGKTRLVQAMAPDERIYVPLESVVLDAETLWRALSHALRLSSAHPEAVVAAVEGRGRPVLWLDGARALAGDAVEALCRLPSAVVTTREAPTRAGPSIVEVPPLSRAEATLFLRERAAPTVLSDATVDAVLSITDGLPGALELAASQAWMGEEVLLEGLAASPSDLLTERAWTSLGGPARNPLMACAELRGSWTPRSLLALTGDLSPVPELRRRALLQVDHDGHFNVLAPVRRFVSQQPDPDGVRDKARAEVLAWAEAASEQLPKDPRPHAKRLRDLHDSMVAIAQDATSPLRARAALVLCQKVRFLGPSADDTAVVEQVVCQLPEEAPLRQALRRQLAWALRFQRRPRTEIEELLASDDHPVALRLRGVLAELAGETEAAAGWFDAVIDATTEDDPDHIFARMQRATLPDVEPPVQQAELERCIELAEHVRLCLSEMLRTAATHRTLQGDMEVGRRLVGRAIDVAEANGQQPNLAYLWNSMGNTLAEDDTPAAIQAFERARDHARRFGDVTLGTILHINLAICRYCVDDLAGADRELTETAEAAVNTRWHPMWLFLRFLCDRAVDDLRAVRWRAQIDTEQLGKLSGTDALAHGKALIAIASVSHDVAAGRLTEAVREALEATEALARDPGSSTLRMLRDHALRSTASSSGSEGDARGGTT